MIDPEVMAQIRALSEEMVTLREDISHLSQKLDGNNANLTQYMERELGAVRDAAARATQRVAEFSGKLDNFTDEQQHFKGDFSWWAGHLDHLAKATEAVTRKMEEAEAKLVADNSSFMEWATTKINMIGRIFRR
jgi:chromosome segregation ATPase